MKPATSNLASRWGLPKPIIKSHAEKKYARIAIGISMSSITLRRYRAVVIRLVTRDLLHIFVFNSDHCTRSTFVPLHIDITNVLSTFFDNIYYRQTK